MKRENMSDFYDDDEASLSVVEEEATEDGYDRDYFDEQAKRVRESHWRNWDERLTELFNGYPQTENDLLEHILQRFRKEALSAYNKVSRTGRAVTNWQAEYDADDHAQTALMQVLEHLQKGDYKAADELRSHLSTLFNVFRMEAGRKKKGMSKFSGLTVEMEDEDGIVRECDNPAIHERPPADETYHRSLPKFIQGTDLLICQQIREGYDYKQIAERLGISLSTVNRRIRWMRETIERIAKEQMQARESAK
jgi:hypothetical protein